MKKLIITILIIILAVASGLNFASAQNETELLKANDRNGEEVKASETGEFNISFDDGYNGYCIDYKMNHAEKGDTFTVDDTAHALNKETGESVGNYLKVFFVDYYEDAMRNKIVTQHTIWHFTDNFNGWRLDYDLIENIKSTALTKTIPDHGAYRQINATTAMVFDFEVLKSGESGNQNFFAYKITYRNLNELLENGTKIPALGINMAKPPVSLQNSTISYGNTTTPAIEKPQTELQYTMKNQSNKTKLNDYPIDSKNNQNIKKDENPQENNEKINLSKHVTGQGKIIGLISFFIILLIVTIKYRRDY